MQKILVVEDDREMNQGISYVLEEEGPYPPTLSRKGGTLMKRTARI